MFSALTHSKALPVCVFNLLTQTSYHFSIEATAGGGEDAVGDLDSRVIAWRP